MSLYLASSSVVTCEGTIKEQQLPTPMKITWEDDNSVSKNLVIPTDAKNVPDQDSLSSPGFLTNIDLYSSGVIITIEKLMIRNSTFTDQSIAASSAYMKLIKKGDTIDEDTKSGIGSLLVLAPIAGKKSVYWIATIGEGITTKPYLEDRVALAYTLNILDTMKSLAGITLETDKTFNTVRGTVGGKVGITIGWNLESPFVAPQTDDRTGATSHVEGGLIGVDLIAMISFVKLGCRVRVAPVMVLSEEFGAGWLVGGTTDLKCKEFFDDSQPDELWTGSKRIKEIEWVNGRHGPTKLSIVALSTRPYPHILKFYTSMAILADLED